MRPLSLCRAASDLHGNGYACPCCRPSFFSASLSFSFSIIHLTHFFSQLSFFFPSHFLLPLLIVSHLSAVLSAWPCLGFSRHLLLWTVLLLPLLKLLFFPPLSASGCSCPVCMNTVWGWSCFPRGSACWRSPRRSFSAWKPWSSSALVSLSGTMSEIIVMSASKIWPQ